MDGEAYSESVDWFIVIFSYIWFVRLCFVITSDWSWCILCSINDSLLSNIIKDGRVFDCVSAIHLLFSKFLICWWKRRSVKYSNPLGRCFLNLKSPFLLAKLLSTSQNLRPISGTRWESCKCSRRRRQIFSNLATPLRRLLSLLTWWKWIRDCSELAFWCGNWSILVAELGSYNIQRYTVNWFGSFVIRFYPCLNWVHFGPYCCNMWPPHPDTHPVLINIWFISFFCIWCFSWEIWRMLALNICLFYF